MNEGMQAILERVSRIIRQGMMDAQADPLLGLQPRQLAEYRAARNWLSRYRRSQVANDIGQVRGYLEAFFHLCNVADWESAYRVAIVPIKLAGDEELHRLLFVWGYYREQKKLYDALLHSVSIEMDLICLSGLGSLHDVLEDYPQAIIFHNQALVLARQLGSVAAQGTALGGLGNAYLSLGEYGRSIEYYQQHLKIARAVAEAENEWASVGIALGNLGNVYRIVEEYELAHHCLRERLMVAQSLNDAKGEGDGLCNLGSLYWVQGKLAEAESVLQQAVEIARRKGHRLGACRAYGNLGLVYVEDGSLEKAIECFEQSLGLASELEDREGQQMAIVQLGRLCQQLNDYEQAFLYQREALGFVEDAVERAALLLNLGSSCREMGRWDEAILFYQELVTTAILMGEDVSEKRLLQMMGLYCLALVHQRKGDFRVAFRYCRRALDLSDESVAPLIDRCLALQEALAREM